MADVDIDIDIVTEAIEKRVAGMAAKIDHFKRVDLGMELSAWQMEDLHRGRPFTMRSRAKGMATTVIRPHSLYEMIRSQGAGLEKKQQRKLVRGIRSKLGHPLSRKFYKTLKTHRRWSTRPILRQVMEERLIERLDELVKEKIKW